MESIDKLIDRLSEQRAQPSGDLHKAQDNTTTPVASQNTLSAQILSLPIEQRLETVTVRGEPRKNKAGVPPILVKRFKTPERLQKAIDEYFYLCDFPKIIKVKRVQSVKTKKGTSEQRIVEELHQPEPTIPTIGGLSIHLGIEKEVMKNYTSYIAIPEFIRPIKTAFDKIEKAWEESLLKKNATGAIFNLKNNWGWKDQSEVLGANLNINDVLDKIEQKKNAPKVIDA